VTDHRTEFQTEPTMHRQQGITGYIRAHLAIAQDEMGQDGKHRFARRALYPPDGHPTQTDTDVMRVACQAPAAATGRLVFQLKAKGQEEGEHELEKRLAIVKQLKVRRFMLKIDGDGPIFAGLTGSVAHGSPSR